MFRRISEWVEDREDDLAAFFLVVLAAYAAQELRRGPKSDRPGSIAGGTK